MTTVEHAAADLADLALSIARVMQAEHRVDADVVQLVASEITVMRHVDRNPGVSAGDAARALGLQRSNLSVTVRNLVEKGMIERRHDAGDRREVHLVPTERAARNLERLRAGWSRLVVEAAPDIDSARIADAVAVLGAIDDGLRRRRDG